MALRIPSNPTVGQIHTFGSRNYIWSGKSWNIYTTTQANASIIAVSTEATEKANAALEQANVVADVATSAFEQANVVGTIATTAFVAANAAFDVANAAYSTANNATDTWVRDTANTAVALAQAAFEQANTGGGGGAGGGGGTPTIATITPTSYDGRSGYTFTLAGTNYDLGTVVDFITANGTTHRASSTSVIDQANLSAITPIPFYANNSPLSIKVTNSGGSSVISNNVIQTGGVPIWNTASGILYTNAYYEDVALGNNSYRLSMYVNEDVDAYDPEGQIVTYNVVSGSLPPNTSLNQITGTITGTLPESLGADTTYSFQLGAFDQTGNMSIARNFDIIVKNTPYAPNWPGYSLYNTLVPTGDSLGAGYYFGGAVDMSGIYAAVGIPRYGADNTGLIEIFNVVTGEKVTTLTNPNAFGTSASDQFGGVFRMKGNYLIVGVPDEDGTVGTADGVAYLYKTVNGTWDDTTLIATITNPNLDAGSTNTSDQFGTTVDIDPDAGYFVVSAIGGDTATIANQGMVYVFNLSDFSVYRSTTYNRFSAGTSDYFGAGLAMQGPTIVFGGPNEDYIANNSGTVVVWDYINNRNQRIDNPTPTTNDYFGAMILVDGPWLIIGAYGAQVGSAASAGEVYVYKSTSNSFYQNVTSQYTVTSTNPTGTAYYGKVMGIDSETGYLYIADRIQAKVDVIDLETGTLIAELNDPNWYPPSTSDSFGQTIDGYVNTGRLGVKGNYLIIGSYSEDSADITNHGVAYIFKAGS